MAYKFKPGDKAILNPFICLEKARRIRNYHVEETDTAWEKKGYLLVSDMLIVKKYNQEDRGYYVCCHSKPEFDWNFAEELLLPVDYEDAEKYFQPGDRFIVNPFLDLEKCKTNHDLGFVPDMEEFIGEEAFVRRISTRRKCAIDELENWSWSLGWIYPSEATNSDEEALIFSSIKELARKFK